MSRYVDAYSDLETDGLADGEKPWCDMTFDLLDAKVSGRRKVFGKDERALSGRAMASTPRGDIGFEFEMEPVHRWRVQKGELDTAWGLITLRSAGEVTDRLVREYEDWFELEAGSAAVDRLETPAVIIGGEPEAFDRSKVHTKLFLQQAQDDETYAEVFLNFDLPHARVQLKEKDPSYRAGLVAWLQGRFGQPDQAWLR